jgi:DNA-binding response OmpR family regulator
MASIASAWVLIIEDLKDQAELCSDVCAETGLNAMTATTGALGYRRACDTRPAIILLDLMLPDMDGWGLLSSSGGRTYQAHSDRRSHGAG